MKQLSQLFANLNKSRLFKLLLFLVFGIGVGVGGSLAPSVFNSKQNTSLQQLMSPESSASASGETFGIQREQVVVKRVIDGDTIELEDGRRVRYIGIDTPETVDPRRPVGCFGKEASAKNKELVNGKTVELEKDISEVDDYKRLLRYVYIQTTEEQIMVNETLVREGYATSSTFPPDVKYQERFTLAEKLAREANVGLWNACSTSPTPTSVSSSSVKPSVGNKIIDNESANPSENTTKTDVQSNSDCLIKGNISSGGKIYHMPGCGSYEKTSIDESAGERWFCTEEEAVNAGWRKAKNC